MTVVVTPAAAADLDEVWRWNAQRHDERHANDYVAFLRRGIDALATNHPHGHPVSGRPTYRYIVIRKRSKGHGHLAVYEVDSTLVSVLRVYHTAQDWQRELAP